MERGDVHRAMWYAIQLAQYREFQRLILQDGGLEFIQKAEIVPDSGTTDCKHNLSVLVSTGERVFYRRLSELKRIDADEEAS